jgi:hypothetical protein
VTVSITRADISSRRQSLGTPSLLIRLRNHPLAAWLALIGLILPSEISIAPGGLKFTAGRLCVALLFVPSVFVLCQRGGRVLLCDLLACAAAGWMLVATVDTGGVSAISSSAGGESFEFLGGYLIGRAYFFGPTALNTFIRVLKMLAIIAIILAIADSISGRLIVHDTVAAIVHASRWPQAGHRQDMVRAASTFDHEILFGVFCSLVAAILLYWEQSLLRRSLSVSLCLLGCILSLSSAALMSFSIVVIAYVYDRMLREYPWRWIAFTIFVATLICAIFVVSNHPLGWVISHLTLDPSNGYYRIMIWDAASVYIAQAPITGYASGLFNNDILDATVDSVWLVYSLRFGLPMIILLILTNVAAFLPIKRSSGNGHDDFYTDRMPRAFTIVLLMFMFTGLTVHFWNYMWIFWGLCIGIRASLRELSIGYSQSASIPTSS